MGINTGLLMFTIFVNKQDSMTTKTTPNNINIGYIHNHFNRNRMFAPIRNEYKINYSVILVLLGCYLYSEYDSIDHSFNKTAIVKYVSFFTHNRITYSFNRLIECNMIALAGARKYTITELGLQTIQQISDNTDNLLYSFCNKYDIIL